MESLAPPGTEDHVDTTTGSSMFVSKKVLKNENDCIEITQKSETDRLLALRYNLPNGSTANVFELTWQYGNEAWYCHVCCCPVMGQVFTHEWGKQHVEALQATGSSAVAAPWKKAAAAGGGGGGAVKPAPVAAAAAAAAPEVRVAPGEPVPPGFEGEITKVAQIQDRFDAFKHSSLIGLEYLLELQDYDREPAYLCLLCGKKGDSRTITTHLVSYKHLHYYFHRHYRTIYNILLPFSTHKMYKKCYQECLTKIADAVEGKYGRMLPHPIDLDTYERNKQEVYDKVNNGPHFSESNGVTFEHLVDVEEIKRVSNSTYMESVNRKQERFSGTGQKSSKDRDRNDLKRNERRSLSSVSSISNEDLSYSPGHHGKARTKPSYTPGLYARRRRSRSRSRSRTRSPAYRSRGEDSLPWNRPDYRRNESQAKDQRGGGDRDRDRDRDRDTNKREEFRRLATAIENDMERQLRQHQINPEKHPQYNEEWKVFWNKRYKELLDEGKNAQGYDFKPEWIVYWNKKMEEFHKLAVKQAIDALRRRLGMAEVAPIMFKINSSSTMSSFARRRDAASKVGCQPIAAQPDQDHEVIVIDDSRDDAKKGREGSHSPWESDSNNTPRKDTRRSDTSRRRSVKSRSRSLSPYRRRYYGRRRSTSRSRSRSGSSRSRSRKYGRRSSRSQSKSPYRIQSDNKVQTSRRSAEWDRAITYKNKSQPAISFAPSSKDVIMVRESTLKKQENLDEQLTAVEDLGSDVNIVAVLRLLTALEDKLGSLGPKVIDLLAQALCMEKKTPNSSEQLLDNEANCIMFETIKEKLKGLLHAGLVTGFPSQEKAVQTSITKIAGLLHLASKRKADKEAKRAAVVSVDRVAIAKQIANALDLQGKTDISQSDLEQLVTTLVSMAEASKDSSKPMTTAAFLQSLQPSPTAASDAKKEKDDELNTSGNSNAKDAMDGLSNLELQTLLQSFKDLSAEEQHGLISYLKKLEVTDPARVETLRKYVYVNLDSLPSPTAANKIAAKSEVENTAAADVSPFLRRFSASTAADEKNESKASIGISDDEDDYSYEDVFKAASKNLSEKEQEKQNPKPPAVESNVTNLFSNVMDTLARPGTSVTTTAPPLTANTTITTTITKTQATPTPAPANTFMNGGNNQQGGYGGKAANFNTWQPPQRGPAPQQQFYNRQFSNLPPPMQQQQMRQPYQQIPPNMQNNMPHNMQQQRFYPNKGGNNYYNRW